MSATVRAFVYAAAMLRPGPGLKEGVAVIVVEMLYVTVTSGLYAGMQQHALLIKRRWLGDLAIVVGVPGLSQALDWLLHIAAGAPTPHKALLSVCIFTLLSALFHRHVMRRGTFLTGCEGLSLTQDFRRVPKLILSFAASPFAFTLSLPDRFARVARSELEA